MPEPQGGSKMPWVILAVIVVVLLVVGFLFRGNLFGKGAGNSAAGTTAGNNSAASTQASGYQAIFLTNGQVYFGKISKQDGDYVTLDDIFYLQVGPQQGSGAATNTPQSISLVKLGNELHGPVDEMHINRTQILFYEDLKASGQVVQAIQQYKANPSNAAGQGAAQTPVQQPAPAK
jgi:hypothetical protein